jgi:LPS sulfotransferase NodH
MKFIILTHGRSGSTYLQQLLDSHPDIACAEELFNVSNKSENSFYTFCRRTYPLLSFFFLRGKISSSAPNFPLRFLLQNYLEGFYSIQSKPIVGFRLIYNQLLHYHALGRWIVKNKIPIIHLQRKNELKVVVSLLKAQATGVYSSSSNETSTHSRIRLQPENILRTLVQLSQEKVACEKIVRFNPTLNISYEDLFEKQAPIIREIMKFLDANDRSLTQPDIVKTNPDRLSDVLENYDEVKLALAGTPWEKFMK